MKRFKKIFKILLLCLIILSLNACNSENEDIYRVPIMGISAIYKNGNPANGEYSQYSKSETTGHTYISAKFKVKDGILDNKFEMIDGATNTIVVYKGKLDSNSGYYKGEIKSYKELGTKFKVKGTFALALNDIVMLDTSQENIDEIIKEYVDNILITGTYEDEHIKYSKEEGMLHGELVYHKNKKFGDTPEDIKIIYNYGEIVKQIDYKGNEL